MMGTLERKVTLSHRIGAGGRVSLKGVTGPISVRGIDGDEVRVRVTYTVRAADEASAQRALEDGEIKVERGDDLLSIETGDRQLSRGLAWLFGATRVHTDLDVELPRWARLRVETVSGSIDASGLAGDQRYRTVSGDIELLGVTGAVDASSVSAMIAVEGAGDLDLRANSVSGAIRARAASFPSFRLSTTSGHIAVAGALGHDGEHRADSISGSLDLATPTGITAELKTLSGSIQSQVAHRLEGGRGNWRAVVGDGAVRVRFSSTSGSVRIMRFEGAATPASATAAPAGAAPAGEAPGAPAQAEAPAGAWAPVNSAGSSGRDTWASDSGATPSSAWSPNGSEAATPASGNGAGNGAGDDEHAAQLDVLRALERGEIGVEEAAARLERARR